MTSSPAADELARVVRDQAGRLAASLVSLLGDFSTARRTTGPSWRNCSGRSGRRPMTGCG
ncbi:hypothetical protein [Kribbella catacumbae]|uniref:hypothetical protein n=1 Tax=Kribbella catacumbae TaxID=460086 RepID=UPI000376EA52|nr:hypothetical protein [Kribbella catacumbae]